jgi:hypothetical protein
MKLQALCDLGSGNASGWHGLRPLALEELPACLEPAGQDGWLRFWHGYTQYRVWRQSPAGSTLWLFIDQDDLVHLVEVFDLPATVAVDPLVRQLGTPELTLDYPLAAQLQRPLCRPGEELIEFVYARRGLALLIGRPAGQPARLVRLRGFEVMPARMYRELFVDLPDVRFFPDERVSGERS